MVGAETAKILDIRRLSGSIFLYFEKFVFVFSEVFIDRLTFTFLHKIYLQKMPEHLGVDTV